MEPAVAIDRRAGRRTDARVPLRRALDLAQRTGATPLAEQARRELLAVGARSNRQIAQHLFITLATVETHLRHVFRKLGITARADLPAQLADGAAPPAPSPR